MLFESDVVLLCLEGHLLQLDLLPGQLLLQLLDVLLKLTDFLDGAGRDSLGGELLKMSGDFLDGRDNRLTAGREEKPGSRSSGTFI